MLEKVICKGSTLLIDLIMYLYKKIEKSRLINKRVVSETDRNLNIIENKIFPNYSITIFHHF